MLNSRIFHIFALFLGAFALFASAGPIGNPPTHLAAVRTLQENGLVRRCGSAGCNEAPLIAVLKALETDIDGLLMLLDGHNSPGKPCSDIADRIRVAIDAILHLDVNVSGSLGPLINDISALLVKILKGIIGGCGKYGLLGLLIELVLLLDLVLADLVGACCRICPGLLPLLLKDTLGLTWNILGFLLTFHACGH